MRSYPSQTQHIQSELNCRINTVPKQRAFRTRARGEMVERSFAHILDRGGIRRAWLRGHETVHKRYLIHVAGFNLGILMRAIFEQGTPREAASAGRALLVVQTDSALAIRLHLGSQRPSGNPRHHHRA